MSLYGIWVNTLNMHIVDMRGINSLHYYIIIGVSTPYIIYNYLWYDNVISLDDGSPDGGEGQATSGW